MRRVAVVGTSGSGKTTFARAVAARLGVRCVELDALHHLPDWEERPTEEFRAEVAEAIAGEAWVVDGNYGSKLGTMVTDAADTVVWLDFPRWFVMQRVVRRTLRRVITREELWSGNREAWSNLYSRDPMRNIIVWSWTTHDRNRESKAAIADHRWVRLRSSAEARRWLGSASGTGRSG